ncbi:MULTISPECIES: efflux RND transporter periplasmic adaptor subunit [Rhodanobacter]|jgi:cobalt-zinc-cadmium efflux system membrane fusion protein|uniref:Efflux transporter periplasmic adaptor subunit n=5 Tax=Rhodanobacter TaxID=75309 RepID=A0A154QFJ2_9GAMM|nr:MULTISPECIES: efflux RND transporter periplasmic adaptor subunit [Rhodanobacter]MBI2784414.1 efflux RND transporter periplasmic adaptor subunit [Gammaproteobacteria bacterium]KZC15912.1 efflux transporter periplasmic adaptor subunit [Rhodanobacter sp. FW104-R8]KZC22570.1 efflux transporter periplasmic adaptor subunit [Rhodanobacter thiooxydans]KZC26483.1 efflux transporter periplasmic adaptor subunit [Rhodanobacter sp. FW510-T8]KZC30288.1 efflux transporter periplasmic adaptor subunit [Rhod
MNLSLLKRSLLGMALLAALAGPVMAQEPAPANPLALDAKAIKDAGIVLDKAATRALTDELKAPGEVKADAYSTVLVSPRVESQVLARKAKLGDVVKTGAPLVVLSSVQVAETQGALIVAEQDWQRIASLGPQAVSARRYNEAKVQRDQARAKLRAYGLSDGQIRGMLRAGSAKADGSYALLAPTAGRIASDEFLIGERVEPGRTLFTLVNDDAVWVEAQLAPGDAARAQPGMDARVLAHDQTLTGKVILSSSQTNERTRTVPVRIEVANPNNLLRPGELVEARIAVGEAVPKLAVPAEAIVLLQNQPTVFLAKGNGTFEPAPVMVGDTRDGWTMVTQGLKAGDTYVRKGAFALKARLLRSQLGEE